MAQKYQVTFDESYQDTKTYRDASPARRRQINRYKKENDISDKHMFLLMFKEDLDGVPEDMRKSGDTASNILLVTGFLLLWNTLQIAMNSQGGANVGLIFLSLGSFLLVVAVYFLGLLNPYKRAVRTVNKKLKEMPEVVDFNDWDAANPDKGELKEQKRQRRK